MTAVYCVVQIASTWLSFAAILLLSWRRPKIAQRVSALGFSVPLAAGPLLLIASMYLEGLTPVLVMAAAALAGKETNTAQPMFEDVPCEHAIV